MAKTAEVDPVAIFKGSLDEFRTTVAAVEGLVVVNFWAQWSAPGRRLVGMLSQLASENAKVKFIKIDIDENPELVEFYQITGLPNVRLFKGKDDDGVPVQVQEIQGLDNPALREAIATHSK
jgi:thioredoxin 1